MFFSREPSLGIHLNVLVCFNPEWCEQPGRKEMHGRRAYLLLSTGETTEAWMAGKGRMISREEPSADDKSK